MLWTDLSVFSKNRNLIFAADSSFNLKIKSHVLLYGENSETCLNERGKKMRTGGAEVQWERGGKKQQ